MCTLNRHTFRDRAAAWWSQVKTTRSRLGKSKISTWDKLKREMQKNFLPFNYDQIMFHKFQNLGQGNRTVDGMLLNSSR